MYYLCTEHLLHLKTCITVRPWRSDLTCWIISNNAYVIFHFQGTCPNTRFTSMVYNLWLVFLLWLLVNLLKLVFFKFIYLNIFHVCYIIITHYRNLEIKFNIFLFFNHEIIFLCFLTQGQNRPCLITHKIFV